MNPLGETFNFSKLKEIVEKNKDKPLFSWMDFIEIFKPGKQGIVGLLKTKTGSWPTTSGGEALMSNEKDAGGRVDCGRNGRGWTVMI